jgi:hypothetical protein
VLLKVINLLPINQVPDADHGTMPAATVADVKAYLK